MTGTVDQTSPTIRGGETPPPAGQSKTNPMDKDGDLRVNTRLKVPHKVKVAFGCKW